MTGKELRVFRRKIGITQDGLASLSGISQNEISKLERGTKKDSKLMNQLKEVLIDLESKQVPKIKMGSEPAPLMDEKVYDSMVWAITALSAQLHERKRYMGVMREEKHLAVLCDFIAHYEEITGKEKELRKDLEKENPTFH